jgi:tetratricopeptide (TPR) repeat protein
MMSAVWFALLLLADTDSIAEQVKRIRELLRADRVADALEEVKSFAERHKNDPEAAYQAGELMQELASSRFARLESVAPDSAEVHELLGHRYAALGKDDEALKEYRKALEKQPQRKGLRFAIGSSLWRVGDRDGALTEFLEETRLNPGHAQANLRSGQILLLRGESDKALPYLQAAVRANPAALEARRELGRALQKLARHAEAKEHLEYVARTRPTDDQVHALLGSVYRALGLDERAKAEMKLHQAILDRKAAEARDVFTERTR